MKDVSKAEIRRMAESKKKKSSIPQTTSPTPHSFILSPYLTSPSHTHTQVFSWAGVTMSPGHPPFWGSCMFTGHSKLENIFLLNLIFHFSQQYFQHGKISFTTTAQIASSQPFILVLQLTLEFYIFRYMAPWIKQNLISYLT